MLDIQPLAIHCTLTGDNLADPKTIVNFTEQILNHLDVLYHMKLYNTLNEDINPVDIQSNGLDIRTKILVTTGETGCDADTSVENSDVTEPTSIDIGELRSCGSKFGASEEDISKIADLVENVLHKYIDSNSNSLRSSRENLATTPFQEIVAEMLDGVVKRLGGSDSSDNKSSKSMNGHRSPDEHNVVVDTSSNTSKADKNRNGQVFPNQ